MKTELTLTQLFNLMDIICWEFLKLFNENATDDSMGNVSHAVSCALFEAVADETGQHPNTIFQGVKNLIEIENMK